MNKLPLIDEEETKHNLLESLIAPIVKEVEKQKDYLKKTDQLFLSYLERVSRIKSVNSTSKYISETNWLKKELYQQLSSEFPAKDDISIFQFYGEYSYTIDDLLVQIPEEVRAIQSEERFRISKSDSPRIQLLKPFKRLLFFFSKIPNLIGNLFRKSNKKNAVWKHTIPLRAMAEYHFKHELIQKSLVYFNEVQQLKCNARNLKWTIDKDINLEITSLLDQEEMNFSDLKTLLKSMAGRGRIQQMIAEFDEKLAAWKTNLSQEWEETIAIFSEHYSIVDTIELNASFYSSARISNKSNAVQFEFKKILNRWRNTQFAQIDDFQIGLELYQLKFCGLTQYHLLESGSKSRIKKITTDFIQVIHKQIDTVITLIDDSRSAETIKPILVSERIKLRHQLEQKSIPLAIEALYENNFPYLIERIEAKIRAQAESMIAKRIIYNKETYNSPISRASLSHFNPKELVEFNTLNPFFSSLAKLKTALSSKLQIIENGLLELTDIVDYNLDTAVNSIDNQRSLEEIRDIAKEGLKRACFRLSDLSGELESIDEIISDKLKKELDKFNAELILLTESETVTNLRIKLAKAKTREKTKAYRRELLDKVRNFIPAIVLFGKTRWAQLKKHYQLIQEKIGFLEVSNEITNELSDFLCQSEEAIERLPFVYRRLFEINPLSEEVFFEGREGEMEQLKQAFQNWKEAKISSAVIIGERGSGTSSLINLFEKQHTDTSIIRWQLCENISSTADFLAFFRKLLEEEKLTDFDTIVTYLKNEGKKVIILEDIQYFYLKKPHGFEALTLLFELISQTVKHIFWLVGTTNFSWNYFQKTLAIERYIKHKIVLNSLTNEQIISLIMKRHKVSGYKLQFEADEQQSKGFISGITTPKDTTQQSLEKTFFNELNHFARSNISLALLYWLRSTTSFKDNTVTIGKVNNIRFHFLSTLDSASIFTLHSLLLHDSLSVSEHAAIFHQAEKQSRMTLMVLEASGILNSINGKYTINQLIYRQVVNVLRNKNLIH